MEIKNPRYANSPLIRLLECYVLWAIDELPATHASTLEELAPELRSTFGTNGNWQEALSDAVKLPPDMAQTIRNCWATQIANASQTAGAKPKAHAKPAKTSHDAAQQFAEIIVDEIVAA